MKKKVNSGQSDSSDIGCEDFSCLEAAHENIFVVDSVFHFIKGNKAFQKFIHPYIGKDLSSGESLHMKGMPASLISQWEDGFKMVFKKKKAVLVDIELSTSSFTGYFAYTLSPVFSENDDIKAVLFIGRDNTENRRIEEVQRLTGDRLTKTLATANDGNWDWDLLNDKVYFDPRYYTLAGYEVDAFPHRLEEFENRVHPDDHDEVMSAARNYLDGTNDRFRVEFRFRKKDGNYLWIFARGSIVERDQTGKPLRFIGTHQDISELKRFRLVNDSRMHLLMFAETHTLRELLEETINEAEKLTDSKIGFFHFIEENQKYVALQNWSTATKRAYCRAEGFDVRYLIDKAGVWTDCLKSRQPVIHNDYASLANKKGLPEGHAALVRELVVPVKRANKLKAILGVGNKPADYTQQDIEAVKQLADLTWDIAEHKKSEEQLKANERKFRTLFENLSQGIFYKAADGKIIDANEAALSMLGLTRSQLLGKDSYDKRWKIVDENYRFIPPEQHPTVIALKTGKQGKDQTLGIYIPEEDRYNWVILNAIPQFLPGEKTPWQVFASMQDITKRKLAEESLKERESQLHEINEQKDKFFSIIAHDLRSPFSSIVGFSELLDEKGKQQGFDGLEEYASIIKQSSHRVMDLLTNMLDWASSHTGRIQFEPKKHDLGELIMETMNDTEDLYSEKKLAVHNGILSGHSIVTADRNMLATVLRNLITNAIKFSMRNGKIFISAIKDDNEIVVSVKDHGVGMPADRLKKLFVIGESESTPGTNNEQGTGLGLLICKEFIDKHNGRIWAESEEGRGSVFSFALPVNN
jgi:PAS domain S-box-containing protein